MGYDRFKGVTQFGYSLFSDQLADSLVEYFKWSFLCIGGFTNVQLNQTTAYGGDLSRLRPVDDPNYIDGQVWEGARSDWVWETGVYYSTQPIRVSGVYINGNFYAPNHATYSHHTNYPLGRIVFDAAIPTSSVVQAEFSFRSVQVIKADMSWPQKLMSNSYRVDNQQYLQFGSGDWDVGSNSRIQLPAIVIEPVPRRTFRGLQLGGGQIVNQDVLFHVLASNYWDRNNLMDIITYQNQGRFYILNQNEMAINGAFPLDYNGSVASEAKTFPQLLVEGSGGYRWKLGWFSKMVSQETFNDPQLFGAVIRATVETDFPEI